MKAELTSSSRGSILTLVPETDEEKSRLKLFGQALSRPYTVNCRGFGYLEEGVEFYIQPMPSSD